MAISAAKNFLNGDIVPDAAAAMYTVPTSLNRVQITSAVAYNYSGGAVILTLYVLQSGDAEAANFKVLTKSLAADESYVIAELIGRSIGQGGKIWAGAAAATSISLFADGLEFTA